MIMGRSKTRKTGQGRRFSVIIDYLDGRKVNIKEMGGGDLEKNENIVFERPLNHNEVITAMNGVISSQQCLQHNE